MRTIEMSFAQEFHNIHGGFVHNKKIRDAVGYLALWAEHNERYCKVVIYGDKDGNLRGIYKDKNDGVNYDILAQFDGQDFSFHS